MSQITSYIGRRILPFTNPRVVCPPGKVVAQGRPNLVIATPKRSGTHIMIDLLLNNLPDYRNKPLYVDLDQFVKHNRNSRENLADLTPDAGYILKTHMPLNTPDYMPENPHIQALIRQGVVVTINRPRAEVCRSIARWRKLSEQVSEERYGPEYDQFWAHWADMDQNRVDFSDLFDPALMQPFLQTLAERTGTRLAASYVGPPTSDRKQRIYLNKTLTRMLGRHAPRVDTTIHTLKS